MAKEKGWWTLSVDVEPSEADYEHIAEMVRQGVTGGEIAKDEEKLIFKLSDKFTTNSVVYLSDSIVPANTPFEIIEVLDDKAYNVHFHHCLFNDYFKSIGCENKDGTVVLLDYEELKDIIS